LSQINRKQNFVGVLESEASRAVFDTLWHSFPQCRVFQDKFGQKDPADAEALANMVSKDLEEKVQ
jgi:hypothetical protein